MKKIAVVALACLAFSTGFSAQTAKARKTITNADLEKFRQTRVKSDPDDENERRRLGLPSREEQEKERQKRALELGEFAAKFRERQAATQNYWQTQVFQLRAEIAAVEAEIGYAQARIGEIPPPQTFYAVGYNPFYGGSIGIGGIGLASHTLAASSQIGGSVIFGNRSQISIGANAGLTEIRRSGFPPNAKTGLTFGSIPYQPGILTVPFTLPTPQNLTREELLARLRLLEQIRAGLYARYSVLEDEARRAGVKID